MFPWLNKPIQIIIIIIIIIIIYNNPMVLQPIEGKGLPINWLLASLPLVLKPRWKILV